MAPIERIHSYLIHPAKNEEEPPEISGTEVPRTGSLYSMLKEVFDRSESECDIDIIFRPDQDGQQHNNCRDLIVRYISSPTVTHGRAVANLLQDVSTHRSGLGLLFLMKGHVNEKHKLVISRFPADQGVIAEEHERALTVEFIERVFMKSAKAYKSAIYLSDSLERGFWEGRAVDRQISGPRELSDYWIREFLASELRTTGPAGTRRLAIALRDAIASKEDLAIRQELISAASLFRNQHGRRRSTRQFVERLALSDGAKNALSSAFPREDLMDDVFEFDRDEFQRHVLYHAVELDNGGLLIAEDDKFNEIFQQQIIDVATRRMKYTTEGQVIDERLRKTR